MNKSTKDQYQISTNHVAVTGIGAITSKGVGVAAFNQALRTGQSAFSYSDHFSMLNFPVIVGQIKEFNFTEILNSFVDLPETVIVNARKAGQRSHFAVQASIIAALEAWIYAKLHQRYAYIDSSRIGLVIAGNNTTQRYIYDFQDKFRKESHYLAASYALHFMDTDHVGTISNVLGIHGEGFTIGGASASGNIGIINGYRLIKHGYVDVCVVVGALADLSPMEIQGFYNIGALGGRSFQDRPDKACRPFDKEHEGFIWGQASGCLILEAEEFAKKEGISILGLIKGVAMNLDGNRSADPSVAGEVRAMEQALVNSQLTAQDINYINAHGSSSPLGDKTETTAIREALRDSASQVWLNSTKSILGHCLWSAGIVEAIATLLQMQGGYVHPNLNLDDPIDDVCRFVGNQKEEAKIKIAMSNSFGFSGINSSIIFSKGE